MLSIETDNRQSVSVMKVKGRVDSETAPELDDALTKLLQDNHHQIILTAQCGPIYLSGLGYGQGMLRLPKIGWNVTCFCLHP
jgi:hypothetical protein